MSASWQCSKPIFFETTHKLERRGANVPSLFLFPTLFLKKRITYYTHSFSITNQPSSQPIALTYSFEIKVKLYIQSTFASSVSAGQQHVLLGSAVEPLNIAGRRIILKTFLLPTSRMARKGTICKSPWKRFPQQQGCMFTSLIQQDKNGQYKTDFLRA